MEFIGKTVKEAVEEGLKTLGVTEDAAEITVKEEPVKGLFGKLKGKAVVEITVKETTKAEEEKVSEGTSEKTATNAAVCDENCADCEEDCNVKEVVFLKKILELLEIDAKVKKGTDGEKEVLTLVTESSSSVIGYRGEVLDAIQTLTGAVANIGNKVYRKVVVDCENYRDRREETLVRLAKKLEQKATEMRRDVQLEPMSPFERRIIHTALADSATVTTKSEGKEPNRYVVIVPNDREEGSKPYNAGANRDHGRGGNFRGGNRGGYGRNGRGDRDGRGDRGGYRRDNHGGNRGGYNKDRRNGGEEKKKSSFGFGTYLGNSFKDKN